MILLQTRILAFVGLWTTSFVLVGRVSASAQDHVEPNVELIPHGTDDEEGIALKQTHPQQHLPTKTPGIQQLDRSPPQTELQQVLQFIEEKFLSFAALNVRPNFANVLRHMERITRAFVKLSTRVDSVHAQLEDMSTHQQNCSTPQQLSVLMDTMTTRLNELDRKLDHLERQVQYPPSYGFTKNLENMSGQLRHIQESLEHMERTNIHFAAEGLRRTTPSQPQISVDFNTVSTKIDDMQRTLSDIATAKHTENTELQFNAVLAKSLDRKLDDLAQIVLQQSGTVQQHLKNVTYAATADDAASHFSAIVEQQHNSTNQLLLQLAEKQGASPSIQRQLEKIPDLLKIVQDLPGVTTDAMDRAEVMFARIQDKVEGIHIHVTDDHQTMSKLETNFEEILDKIDQIIDISKQSSKTAHFHDTIAPTQPASSSLDGQPANTNHVLMNTTDANAVVTLIHQLNSKLEDVNTICKLNHEPEQGKLANSKEQIDKFLHSSHHNDHTAQQNESSVLASTIERIDMTSNQTQEKLDYITSAMASFQADHSLISFSLDEVMRQIGKLKQKADEVLQETETLKLVKKCDSHTPSQHGTEQPQAAAIVNNMSHHLVSEKMYDILLHVKDKIDDLHNIRHDKKSGNHHHDSLHHNKTLQHDKVKASVVSHIEAANVDSTYYEAVIKHLMQLQAIVDKLSRAMSERDTPSTTCPTKEWETKIERILTHNKHNLDHLLKQLPTFNGTAAAVISSLTTINDDFAALTLRNNLELEETKKISERIDTLHAKVDLINNDSLSRVMRLIDLGERSKNGSQSWELTTTAMLQTIYDRVAEVDQDASKIQATIQKGMDALLEKMKLAADSTAHLHKLHPVEHAATHLSLHKTNETTDDLMTNEHATDYHDSDDISWKDRPDITYSLQSVLDDKLEKMKINIQNIVDNGVFQFVDFIGQQKLMMQQSLSTFIHEQNENMAKMMETLATQITKGFDDTHFMFQLISGKMDKMYHISAHNLEDCADIQKSGHTQSGVYTIYPRNSKEIRVFCDMETEGGGWTVIQRRGDYAEAHRTSFNETWINYKYGFGNLEREFWMGNENIHVLTSQGNYILRIDLLYADPDPKLPRHRRKIWHNLKNTSRLYAQYNHFHVQSERHNYTMTAKGYKGIHPHDGLEGRSGHAFVTWDHAGDFNLQHCAKIQGGGWWYGVECFRFALNSKHKQHYWEDGNLFTGITWGGTADIALLKHVEMKILPHTANKRQPEHIPSRQ